MAEKKKTIKKPKKEQSSIKFKSLWDHVRHIYEVQDSNYIDSLSTGDLKSFNVYMINRILSMNPDWIDFVNYIQKYTELSDKCYYAVLIHIVPKGRYFIKYIKGSSDKYNEKYLKLVADHYQVSTREAIDYLDIINLYPNGKEEMVRLCTIYGKDKSEISELCEIKQ